jgi:hypothetical protein
MKSKEEIRQKGRKMGVHKCDRGCPKMSTKKVDVQKWGGKDGCREGKGLDYRGNKGRIEELIDSENPKSQYFSYKYATSVLSAQGGCESLFWPITQIFTKELKSSPPAGEFKASHFGGG